MTEKLVVSLEHQGAHYTNFAEADLVAAGVPAVIIAAARAGVRREAVKAECRRRIYGVGPAEAQINVTAMTAAIGTKAVADRSTAEMAIVATAQSSIDWVMTMRERFGELADDPDADYLADASWPACPADVVALYQQF